ncbi:MAG: hypothetical protein VZQ61_06900, partial [Christensenellaceae bacterium]
KKSKFRAILLYQPRRRLPARSKCPDGLYIKQLYGKFMPVRGNPFGVTSAVTRPTVGIFKSFSVEREDLSRLWRVTRFSPLPFRELHAYKTLEKSKV